MAKISCDSRSIDLHLLQLLIPEDIIERFELNQIIENDTELLFDLTEKETIVPKELTGKEAILDGYMKSTTLQSYPQKGKHCYINSPVIFSVINKGM